MSSNGDYSVLKWIRKELDVTLQHAAVALESYAEGSDDPSELDKVADYLHQVYGTLQMVELYGASLLLEEMELVVGGLREGIIRQKEDAVEVLSRAILQIPDYLERLQAGHKDIPLVLLPLLNDLRASRGANLVSEAALFSPDLEWLMEDAGKHHRQENAVHDLPKIARKLRLHYHKGLLGWFREQDPDGSIKHLGDVIGALEKASTFLPAKKLWWIIRALFKALAEKSVTSSVAIKLLLGHADQQIKRVIDNDEATIANEPHWDFIKNLLYYVARAKSDNDLICSVQKAFALDKALPSEDEISAAQDDLSAPNLDLMRTVTVAIKEDLAGVKDILDLFVRGGQSQAELRSLIEPLHKIADTLGMMGQGALRKRIMDQGQQLTGHADSGDVPTENDIMQVAGELLVVESTLDALLTGGMDGGDEVGDELGGGNIEFRSVLNAVLQEVMVDLSKAKDAIVDFIDAPNNTSGLERVPTYFEHIHGAFNVLRYERADHIVSAVRAYVMTDLLEQKKHPVQMELEAFADAITSIEYYVEAIQENRSNHARILDIAQESVQELGYAIKITTPSDALDLDTEFNDISADQHTDIDIDASAFEIVAAPVSQVPSKIKEEKLAVVLEPVAAASKEEFLADVDEEILEIFIEEAGECVETIREYYPMWKANSQHHDALATFRRSFHTIKGSGRMVNAAFISEVAWSVESMLNRLIEESIRQTPSMLKFLDMVVEVLPGLIQCLLDRSVPTVDTQKIMDWGDELTKGEKVDIPDEIPRISIQEPKSEPEPEASSESQLVLSPEPEDAELRMDPILFDIFNKESNSHLQVISEFLVQIKSRSTQDSVFLDDPVRRALHTLHGSAHMAGVTEIALLSRGLEQLAKAQVLGQQPLSDNAISILDEGVLAITGMLRALQDPSVIVPEYAALIERTRDETNAVKVRGENAEAKVDSVAVSQDEGESVSMPAGDELDDELLEIFLEEGLELIDGLDSTMQKWAIATDDMELVIDFQRSLHTLKGGARLAGLTVIGDLSHALESLLTVIANKQMTLDDTIIDYARRATDELAGMVDIVGRRQVLKPATALVNEAESLVRGNLVDDANIVAPTDIQDVDELVLGEDVDEVVATSVSDDSLGDSIDISMPDEEIDISMPDEEIDISMPDEAIDISMPDEAIDISMPDEVVVPAVGDAISIPTSAMSDNLADTGSDDAIEIASPEPGVNVTPDDASLETAQGLPDEVDEDLLEVFLEEGQELIDVIETTLAQWKNDPEDKDHIISLQRSLHTLKGGARLSGLMVIGDLSHILESMFIAIVEGNLIVSEDAVIVTHAVSDRLAEMVDCVSNRKAISPATELIARVDNLLKSEITAPAPAPADQVAPEESLAPLIASSDEQAVEGETTTEPSQQESAVDRSRGDRRKATGAKRVIQEQIRVRADLLDDLVNFAGEVSIYRARLEQQNGSFRLNITELDQTVLRLKEQLRRLELETEAQILSNVKRDHVGDELDFDPLEMDRYSTVQQLSRALMESVSDLTSLQDMMDNTTRETETLLLQQSRVITELQEGLMRTRMVPFSSIVPRMSRLVRQTCGQTGKKAELHVVGAEGEMDRAILDGMVAPLEHMMRNSISHGIEVPEVRENSAKSATGKITMRLSREGTDLLLIVDDDGGGINLDNVKKKARELGMLQGSGDELSEDDLLQFLLESGFSTAQKVTQIAGRGVGMDVVNSQIKQLGGSLELSTKAGQGTSFTIRLPFTLAINQALLVQIGEDIYAVPHSSIDGIVRLSKEDLERCYASEKSEYEYAGHNYQVRPIGQLLGAAQTPLAELPSRWAPILLVRAGLHRVALQVDSLMGNREIVVKSVGPQLSTVRWISGATILGDGRVVLILDLSALVRSGVVLEFKDEAKELEAAKITVMVVDDSITVRKVTTRLLERHNMNVLTAKDGVDAVGKLQEDKPDIMLLDIEMPRMDGYELAQHIRNNERLMDIPIIMITSRTGEKHRKRAMEIGVDSYLGKPYQEAELLKHIDELLTRKTA